MIVQCPSCGTRYQHHQEQPATECRARCSRCRELVPLAEAKRNYLLLPFEVRTPASTGRPPRPGIGMDDPTLADRLRETALTGIEEGRAEALTYRVEGEPAPTGEPGVSESGDTSAKRTRRGALTEMLLSLIAGGAGAVSGYSVSLGRGLDPEFWTAVGAGCGLLFGWVCIRWMRRRR